MKYAAPKAEVVELELNSDILLLSEPLLCLVFDPENPGCTDKLPDFYE